MSSNRRAQFVQQAFRDEHQIFVRERIRIFGFVRQIREFKRFLAVRRDERKVAQIQMMHRLRVEAQPHAALAAERFDFVQQRLRDDAFAVIADDDGVGLDEFRFEFRQAISPVVLSSSAPRVSRSMRTTCC